MVDPPKDTEAAKVLVDQGNDILFTTTDSPSVVTLAEKTDGVWVMMHQWDSSMRLITMMFNWNVLYKHIADLYSEGKLTRSQRWNWGIEKNCVGLSMGQKCTW